MFCSREKRSVARSAFSNNPSRVQYREELNRLLEPIFLQKSKEEWRESLQKRRCALRYCSNSSRSITKSFYIVEHEHPNGPEYQKVKTLGLPFSIDGEPRSATKRAPRLNEHYEEVLMDWLGNRDL